VTSRSCSRRSSSRLKFDPAFASTTMAIYLTLTSRAGAERPDLIVWPRPRRRRRSGATPSSCARSARSPAR
jgi:hypothetical protein